MSTTYDKIDFVTNSFPYHRPGNTKPLDNLKGSHHAGKKGIHAGGIPVVIHKNLFMWRNITKSDERNRFCCGISNVSSIWLIGVVIEHAITQGESTIRTEGLIPIKAIVPEHSLFHKCNIGLIHDDDRAYFNSFLCSYENFCKDTPSLSRYLLNVQFAGWVCDSCPLCACFDSIHQNRCAWRQSARFSQLDLQILSPRKKPFW